MGLHLPEFKAKTSRAKKVEKDLFPATDKGNMRVISKAMPSPNKENPMGLY
jgi:hypothetical protein